MKSWKQKWYLYQIQREIRKKCKDFHRQGYKSIFADDLYSYLQHFRWKHKQNWTLKQKKEDVHKVTVNDFFDYQQVESQKKAIEEFDWNQMEDLL